MIGHIIGILFAWNVLGALFMGILTANLSYPGYIENILSPIWIYDAWKLNYFGTGLVCILLNLLCPVWAILVWGFKFLIFVCTVGRK